MLILMKKFTHEEHLSQPLQSNNKQFKTAITFLSGYNVTFKRTNKNNKFFSQKHLLIKMVFFQITIPPGLYEIESLNIEIRRNIIVLGHFTETDYPFTTKPNL